MATSRFVPGQRWFSETQPELGLGLVDVVANRRVRLQFPATGEQRVYAVDAAPLRRARFAVGESVRAVDGRGLAISTLEETAGLIRYRGHDAAGYEWIMAEAELDAQLRLDRPPQRFRTGSIDAAHWFQLRMQTWEWLARAAAAPARGLVGARIQPVAHQLYIAAEVADRYAPRVLLADEVGLGKTIEAGLILHRLLLAGRVQRVLILVPEPLLHQWLVELLRRFNLAFVLFDAERLAASRPEADPDQPAGSLTGNPFEDAQQVLCPLELLADPAHAAAAVAAPWDLLICDEAHHLTWTPAGASPAYQLVAALAARTPAVLLLTATPEQFGRAGHFGRLRLLDPRRFGDYQAFLDEEAAYAPVAEIAIRLLACQPLTAAQQAQLGAWLGAWLGEGAGANAGAEQDLLVARLLDRHGTSRVLFRNTRAAIAGFPGRTLAALTLPRPPGYLAPDEAALGALAGAGGAVGGAADWVTRDPRIPWLIALVRRLRPAKLVLICRQTGTVLDLRRALQQQAGLQAAVFHAGMTIVERDRAAAFFADPDDGTPLLLCSEIGSEGRNFQFSQHLVLFDLPLEPELLEQRIGRLDRIGQHGTITLHLPVLAAGPGATLQRWYAEALDAFSAPCPAAGAVYAQLGEQLRALLATQVQALIEPSATAGAPPAALTALLETAAALRRTLAEQLAAGSDRLLELGSCRPGPAAALVAAIARQDQDPALPAYLRAFWDAWGIEHEPGPGGAIILRPGPQMHQEEFPGLPAEGLTATLDRADALAHEDRAFLTLEHPLVRTGMELVIGSTLGTTALLLARDPRLTPGALLLELIYCSHCPAPPGLQVGRFLPLAPVRLLLDERGRARDDIDPERLGSKCLRGNRRLTGALIAAKGTAVTAMLEAAEPLVARATTELVAGARQRMTRLLEAEQARLVALQVVNPAVRPEEIVALQQQRDDLTAVLGRLHLRLDALRLIAFA